MREITNQELDNLGIPYCGNPMDGTGIKGKLISIREVLDFLDKERGAKIELKKQLKEAMELLHLFITAIKARHG